jgi:HEAT repeat protein
MGAEARGDLPAIRAMLKDKDPVARCQAAIAVWKLDHDAGGVPVLIDGLHSSDPFAQAVAVFALGVIGPEAKEAVAQLRKMLPTAEPLLRKTLLEAIRQIDPDALPRRGER